MGFINLAKLHIGRVIRCISWRVLIFLMSFSYPVLYVVATAAFHYMSIHLEAKQGDIAKTVLITGDPLRARHFAKSLDSAFCYNGVRGMEGYTGYYKGKRISIQGTGIGIPSTALYMHELIHDYGVQCVIRVGTCGAIQQGLALGQLILVREASTDSGVVQHYHREAHGLPKADASLFALSQRVALNQQLEVKQGAIFSTDLFYHEDPQRYDPLIAKGVLAVDMESSMVYAMARYFSVKALSVLTISDNILTKEALPPEDRELRTTRMLTLALEVAFEDL